MARPRSSSSVVAATDPSDVPPAHSAPSPASIRREASGLSDKMVALTVLFGEVVSAAVVRDVAGARVAELDVRARAVSGRAVAVSVVFADTDVDTVELVVPGDTVMVVGTTRRRFFRSGGATVSRTEVEATQVAINPDRRRRRRLVDAAVASLEPVAS
jgi:hypothetical protein